VSRSCAGGACGGRGVERRGAGWQRCRGARGGAAWLGRGGKGWECWVEAQGRGGVMYAVLVSE
jgi:hypothetical protein